MAGEHNALRCVLAAMLTDVKRICLNVGDYSHGLSDGTGRQVDFLRVAVFFGRGFFWAAAFAFSSCFTFFERASTFAESVFK